MKPLKLQFSGLNSYRQMQTVDFSALAERGLFGIFGPTGAGKSTVLDAITLALYGEVDRAANKTQGMINAREKSCYASFEFELGGHIYQAERLYERKKDDAFASRVKSCRLIEDDQRVLADKSEDMTREIIALLGMDRSRFCQTVILPQGKFDKLLTMAPAERSSMLEELFQFSAYGEALVKKVRQHLREAEDALDSLREQRLLLGDCSPTAIKAAEAHDRELRQRMQEQAAIVEQKREALRKSELIAHQAGELAGHERELAGLSARRPAIELDRLALERGLAAEQLRRDIDRATETHLSRQAARQGLREAYITACGCLHWQHERWQATAVTGGGDPAAQAAAAQADADRAAHRLNEAEALLIAQRREEKLCYERWQKAEEAAEALRRDQAAAFLAATLQPGRPCPVCGGTDHRPVAHDIPEQQVKSALSAAQQAKELWRQQGRLCESSESGLHELRQDGERLRREAEQARALSERLLTESEIMEQAWRQGRQRLAELSASFLEEPEHQGWRQAGEAEPPREGDMATAQLQLAQALSRWEAAEALLLEIQEQLRAGVETAGFATANEAKKALLSQEQRQQLLESIRVFDEQERLHTAEIGRLKELLRGQDPMGLEAAEREAREAEAEQNSLHAESGRAGAELARLVDAAKKDAALSARQKEAQSQADTLKRLSGLLKGNAFVRWLAHGSLLSLAHEASHILAGLTNNRYQLQLVEDSRGSDFIMADNHNGGLQRPVASLSGGETFLVSLALSLALSQKIQMRSARLGFFFLDEGFGSLDENSLEAALTVLERLPSDQRSVGVITHVQGVRERMPRYLLISSDPLHGSKAEMRAN